MFPRQNRPQQTEPCGLPPYQGCPNSGGSGTVKGRRQMVVMDRIRMMMMDRIGMMMMDRFGVMVITGVRS